MHANASVFWYFQMKIAGFFNKIDSGNIGLENFMSQGADCEKVVLLFKQTQKVAVAEMRENYGTISPALLRAVKGDLVSLFAFLMEIKKISPDVIHAHHAHAALVASMVKLLFDIPMVTTAHANYKHYTVGQKVAFAVAFLCSDIVICNSKNTMASLPLFVRRRKVRVIYNGVNFARIDKNKIRRRLDRHNNVINIGAICRLVAVKDLPTLIRGFARASGKSSNALHLTIIGGGDQRKQLERLVVEFDLQEKVRFTGPLTRDDVYANLHDLDILVVSSKSEGFCNAMVEAAGAAKAVIATNIQSLREIIGINNALFFEVGNDFELSAKLLSLAEDVSRRESISAQACDHVRSQYDLPASAAQYRDVYEALARGEAFDGL